MAPAARRSHGGGAHAAAAQSNDRRRSSGGGERRHIGSRRRGRGIRREWDASPRVSGAEEGDGGSASASHGSTASDIGRAPACPKEGRKTSGCDNKRALRGGVFLDICLCGWIVYDLLPRAPIDLMPLQSSEKLNFDAKQRTELMLKLHETTKENIERMNAKYKFAGDKGRRELNFEPGDLVLLHLQKEWFPDLRKSKLMPRADGPSKVLAKINENAYKLDLPADFGVSSTFNVADLKSYLGEEDELESRTIKMQEGEDDEDINTIDTSTSPQEQVERIQRGEDSRGLDSDCRTAPTSDGRHDFMRTPIWACKYFTESLSSLLSNGSSHMSISVMEQPQLSFYYRVFFVHGATSPLLGRMDCL
uniref:OSJNBa0094P09.14 protein n=1 Tax=Oryza sativa subsp. japonica TaxID=39947 RepID=Q7XLL3_ORYSJ|nr:OSJNBa0094P09.14 [Oryza sativa Japonica Group]